ncbi:unnamed protein product [Diamesa hyperborea]
MVPLPLAQKSIAQNHQSIVAVPNQIVPLELIDRYAVWVAIERECGCRTYFDYDPFEFTSTCSATENPLPPIRVCKVECPTC